jgi:hypothetical protein
MRYLLIINTGGVETVWNAFRLGAGGFKASLAASEHSSRCPSAVAKQART